MPETQLQMRRPNFDGLPPITIPEGCGIRTYHPGDEDVWAQIMNTGQMGEWHIMRVITELTTRPQFDPQGLFFVTLNGEPVGSACAWKASPDEHKVGIVHMVCVLPEARGRNLGYLATLCVLHYFRGHGFSEATLSTDDFRLGAVKAYLKLGFEPVYVTPEHVERWERIREIFR